MFSEDDEEVVVSEYPKHKHSKDGRHKVVNSVEEEEHLGDTWKDSPADHGIVTHPHSEEYLARQERIAAKAKAAPKAKANGNGQPAKE